MILEVSLITTKSNRTKESRQILNTEPGELSAWVHNVVVLQCPFSKVYQFHPSQDLHHTAHTHYHLQHIHEDTIKLKYLEVEY